MTEIRITCETKELIKIDKLKDFQGNLKAISPDDMEKLKRSIIDYGFSFPIFVWRNNIINGHQRIKAVRALIDDGYIMDNVPVVRIVAGSKKEAAEKLLLENSRYAKIIQDGFDAFIDSFEIDLSEFSDILNIPDIDIIDVDLNDIDDGNDGDGDGEYEERDNFEYQIVITCENEEHQRVSIASLESMGYLCRPLIL